MSTPELPHDPADWPRDPFRLLGVAPGVSARDLRKAYLALIRVYKPEHAPGEFRRIRDAYEAILPFVGRPDTPLIEAGPQETYPFPTPTGPRPDPPPDPWLLAMEGDPEAAYRGLVGRIEAASRPTERDYLRPYWLLSLRPALDPARRPVEWLFLGVSARGDDSPCLRELLRRAMANPEEALDQGAGRFVRGPRVEALEAMLDVAEARWQAAMTAGRFDLPGADLWALRAWLPEADERAWARALATAARLLAWGDPAGLSRSVDLVRELDAFGSRHPGVGEDLDEVDYAGMVRSGLGRLGALASWVGRWVTRQPDTSDALFRAGLGSYLAEVSRDPLGALKRLDAIHHLAPAVIGRISGLIGGVELEADGSFDGGRRDEITPTLAQFLDGHPWADYPAFRSALLTFCLREAISPGLVARTLADRPAFILTGKSPLAHAILDDWPLRHAYRAVERHREGVDGA